MEARRAPTGCTKGDLAGENGLSQRCSPVGTFRRVALPLRISVRDFESAKSLDEFSWSLARLAALLVDP